MILAAAAVVAAFLACGTSSSEPAGTLVVENYTASCNLFAIQAAINESNVCNLSDADTVGKANFVYRSPTLLSGSLSSLSMKLMILLHSDKPDEAVFFRICGRRPAVCCPMSVARWHRVTQTAKQGYALGR
jgi:hypothetical protein